MGPASHSRQGLHRQRGGSDDRKTEAIASRYPGSTETAFLFGKQREGQHPSSGSWLSRRGNARGILGKLSELGWFYAGVPLTSSSIPGSKSRPFRRFKGGAVPSGPYSPAAARKRKCP